MNTNRIKVICMRPPLRIGKNMVGPTLLRKNQSSPAAFGYIDCIFSPRCVAAQQANYVAASCTPSRRRRLGCRPFTFLREASTQLGA
jgi:hypothetical protein